MESPDQNVLMTVPQWFKLCSIPGLQLPQGSVIDPIKVVSWTQAFCSLLDGDLIENVNPAVDWKCEPQSVHNWVKIVFIQPVFFLTELIHVGRADYFHVLCVVNFYWECSSSYKNLRDELASYRLTARATNVNKKKRERGTGSVQGFF